MRTLAIFLLFAATARADVFNMPTGQTSLQFVTVGNPGNAADQSHGPLLVPGAVNNVYNIGKYEVTNAQYFEFLNEKDPIGLNLLGLYNASMTTVANGGIAFTTGNVSGTKYSAKPGHENQPVNFVSWYDSLRFVNWLANGQGNGSTESGAYSLLGGTTIPTNNLSIARSPSANFFLPNQDEWYKSAFYSGANGSYFLYPTASDSAPVAEIPPGGNNSANYKMPSSASLTDVGAYASSTGPYGTFDQAGNVVEWNESFVIQNGTLFQFHWGGDYQSALSLINSAGRSSDLRTTENQVTGFRVAAVPEPSTLILAALGLVIFAQRMKTPAA